MERNVDRQRERDMDKERSGTECVTWTDDGWGQAENPWLIKTQTIVTRNFRGRHLGVGPIPLRATTLDKQF